MQHVTFSVRIEEGRDKLDYCPITNWFTGFYHTKTVCYWHGPLNNITVILHEDKLLQYSLMVCYETNIETLIIGMDQNNYCNYPTWWGIKKYYSYKA